MSTDKDVNATRDVNWRDRLTHEERGLVADIEKEIEFAKSQGKAFRKDKRTIMDRARKRPLPPVDMDKHST